MPCLDTLLTFITHHPGPAYSAVFLISLSESLALVGLLVPGTVIMFGIGAVVATGSLSLLPVLLTAMAGAVAGDGVSYWLGHHYKERLVNIWPFSRYPGVLKKGEAFFHRHGGKSVLFGRFVGPVRPVIPVVAGMLGMRPGRFSVVNVLSAVGWALVYILPGVFLGASLAVVGTVSTRLAVLILIFMAGAWSLIGLCRKAVSLFERKGPAGLAALKHWATREVPRQGSAIRPLKRFLSFLIFSAQGEELLFAFLALVLFAAGWGFLGVLQDVLAKDPLVVADQAIYHFLQSLRTAWADNVLVAVTELGDSFVNITLACAVLLVLLVKRCRRAAAFWALAVLGGFLAVQLLKWTIHLPRPVAIYHGASAYGFPSGHTTMSVVLYGFLAILMVRQVPGIWRWGLFAGVVLIAFNIGFSRLYLGAHWLSDVLGGYFIGTSWATLLGIAYLKRVDKAVPRRLLGGVVIVTVIMAGGWHVARQHQQDLSFYAPRHKIQTITRASWLAGGWRNLPTYRIDLAGERKQPLTIQWSGSTDALVHYLLSKQWQPPPPLDLKDFLRMLSPDTPIAQLPVLPRLHNGLSDAVRLVHPVDDTHRWVLRLWPTNVNTSDKSAPLFEGTIEVQYRRLLADMILLATNSGAYDVPLNSLQDVLEGRFAVKLVARKKSAIMFKTDDRQVDWQGGVLLISQGQPAPEGAPIAR